MSLTMKELMKETGESKSTIHYYLKEGLLPEPEKPKPNVHYYQEECIQIIKFIKYLQTNFSYSISEIKGIFEYNNFDFNNSFESLIKSLQIMFGSKDNKWYTKEELLELSQLTEQELIEFKRKEYLIERTKGYSSQEIQMAKILKKAKNVNLDFKVINEYVKSAKHLAHLEYETGAKLLNDSEEKHNEQYEILFQLILSLKPYIFNNQTVLKHQEKIVEEN